ncbi:MAG TPA: hypothetical protein VGM94_11965 [Galbitalea sp.]|jgi:hypothetical protein
MTDGNAHELPDPEALRGSIQSTPADPASWSARKSPWTWALPVITGVVGIAIGAGVTLGIGIVTAASAHASAATRAHAEKVAGALDLSRMLSGCSIPGDDDALLGDGGYTLTLNGQGNDDASGISLDNWTCIETSLKMPQSIVSHIEQTSSLDGRQQEAWSNYSIQWTYHPDRGLDGVITRDR